MRRLLLFLPAAVAAGAMAGERLTVPTPQAAVERMVELAHEQPGFLGVESAMTGAATAF